MKTRVLTFIILFILISSCGLNKKDDHDHEHEHETPVNEGIVVLNNRQMEALNLELGTFLMRNITTLVRTNGQLEVPPASSADVTTMIGGNVKEILVFHGDKVRKRQPLVILEHPDFITLQENFAEIANQLEVLEQEYHRQKTLFENNAAAGKAFQQAKADYNTGRARYEGLKSRIEFLNLEPEKVREGTLTKSVTIYAPISGFVSEINIKVGSYVDPKDILFSISNNDAIHADFLVYEKDIHLLKEGQKVDFSVSNRPGEELTATIFAIGKEFEPETRAVHIHAKLDKNPGDLIPGMYISGNIHTDENYSATLPYDALVSEGAKTYIFVQDREALKEVQHHEHNEGDEENGKIVFRMTEVLTGQSYEGYVQISTPEPLPDSARIVMNAAYYLLAEMRKGETEHEH